MHKSAEIVHSSGVVDFEHGPQVVGSILLHHEQGLVRSVQVGHDHRVFLPSCAGEPSEAELPEPLLIITVLSKVGLYGVLRSEPSNMVHARHCSGTV
jgi:hypothetical protein